MSKQEYSPVMQATPTSESFHSSNDSSTDLLESKGHHDRAFVPNPTLTYTQFLAFFLVFLCLPWTFVAILSKSDGIPAPRMIADFAMSNPRLTPQITTIIASTLTACVKWALAGVVTIRAQKHFRHSRYIYKIEVFSALKNGGIAWSWKRRWLMFWTTVVVVLCGLLTSGFVALISPFPIESGTEIGTGSLDEVDFASTSDVCQQWHNNVTLVDAGSNDCPKPHRYRNSSFIYTVCRNVDPLGDVANAAKSSMLYQFASQFPSNRLSTIAQSFAQLGNVRFLGSTAGTLPTGPAGLDIFPKSNFPLSPTTSSSYNYTLEQLGMWVEASCSYTNDSRLVPQGQQGNTKYQLNCMHNETMRQWNSAVDSSVLVGAIVVGLCYSEQNDNFTFHLRSFWKAGDEGNPPDYVYAGVGKMACSLTPRVGQVNTLYRAELGAFQAAPSSTFTSFTSMTNISRSLVIEAMGSTVLAIDWGQTSRNGNMFGTGVSSIAMMYGNVTGQQQNPIIPSLVADALKGIFEYKITNQHVIAAVHAGTYLDLDPTCFRRVTGRLVEGVIGWELKFATILGLVPLLIISVACLGVTVWTMLRKDRLTVFDPTSPIALIGAVADGKLRFSDERDGEMIGDPEDETVLNTKVRYEHHDGRWGLRRKSD